MTCRILVAEDSATQAEALRALLEEQQYEVTVARNGEAALECVATEDFDMVLSDVVMPGITGYELCRGIKQDPRLQALPVMLLTSLTDPMDIVRGLECGADNYITKPYDPEHLLARVRHVLDNRRFRRGSKTSLGVTVRFLGRDLTITSEREQILDLFISSVEDVVRANEALHRSQEQLAEAHAQLERYAQEKAREARISAVRYRALLQNAGDAILVLDPEGRILEANRGASELLNLSVEELSDQTMESLLAPSEREQYLARFATLAGEGQVKLGEYCFRKGEANEIWCELTASLTEVDAGALVLVIARDITERKRMDEALRQTNQQLQTLIESSPLAIFTTDLDYRVGLWNPAAERVFGYSGEEVLGHPLPIVPEDKHAECLALRDRVLADQIITGMEAQRLRKDGRLVDVSISAAPLRGSDGRIDGIIGFLADITERKQVEAVRQEREEAERANRAKSEFLSRMSHELRTPMNAILGFAQLLEIDSLDEEKRESVEQILSAGRHLLMLIDEVLDLSRIEAGKLSLSLEPVEVAGVVRDTIGLIRPLADQRKISIRTEPAPLPERFVQADLQRLKQVLLNLLSNGVKYNRDGGSLTLRVEETGTGWLRIGVRDTGPGLSAREVEKLFVPFERLDAEKGGTPGTGLGLVLSRSLVQAMGGRIGVESVKGEGSVFWVELPLVESPAPVRASPEPLPAHVPASGAPNASRSVLYIEDNPSNLRLVERMLKTRPEIRLLVAMQGSLGLDLAREHRPDLILLDLNLPDLSGREVLRRLQDSPELRGTPTVVVSADARADRIDDLRREGAQDYLVKPFDVRRFLELVDSYLREER